MSLGAKAKKTLEEFAPEMDRRVGEYFDREIAADFGFSSRQKQLVREMLEQCREYSLRPQKRLRSSFVYYAYLLGGKPVNEAVWEAAIGTELVQAGLLMQDDFMDRDEKRRGGKTMHRIYGDKLGDDHLGEAAAVTAGIALEALGYELVAKSGNKEATVQMVRGIAQTAYGQAYDLILSAGRNWTSEDVLAMHAAKTAVYTYENPLVVGGLLAGLREEAISRLREYARDGGVAFQLQDDILGVFGKSDKTGKSADSDLLQGKCTLLVLKVLEEGTAAQKQALKKVWGRQTADEADITAAREAVEASGAAGYSRRLARDLAEKAAAAAGKLREMKLDTGAVDYLQGIAEYMVEREV